MELCRAVGEVIGTDGELIGYFFTISSLKLTIMISVLQKFVTAGLSDRSDY